MSKVALVTGASRGIGRSIAEALGAAGYAVVVNFASRREAADATAAAISAQGGTAVVSQADVSDSGAVARMFDEIDGRFGRLDALVNNAGIGRKWHGWCVSWSLRRPTTSPASSSACVVVGSDRPRRACPAQEASFAPRRTAGRLAMSRGMS